MTIKTTVILNEDRFFSKLVPFFEEIRSKLLAILGRDEDWRKLLSQLYLVYDDSGNLQITHDTNRHLYLADSSHSNTVWNDNLYYSIPPMLRWIFIEEILTRSKPQHIGEYVRRLLSYSYQNVEEKKDNPKYIRYRFTSINTSDALIALSRYKTNVVIPTGITLDAAETVGWTGIDHRKGIDRTVLVTSNKDIEGYKNFDTIFDFKHLRLYLHSNFTSAISFFQRILGITYEDIFDIADLIGASSEGEIFWLKRELISLPFSEGQAFEDSMERFLKFCFKSYFQRFGMEVQHATFSGQRRRDFIITNNQSNSSFLKELKKEKVKFLLFDAKNYRDTLRTKHLDTFRGYLLENPNFGNFGIILSRTGASKPCQRHIFETTHFSHIKPPLRIIVLDQDDLLTMLDFAFISGSPLEVIETKVRELSLGR